jgi:hypothetical protein
MYEREERYIQNFGWELKGDSFLRSRSRQEGGTVMDLRDGHGLDSSISG